jgi:hypothetical protein
MDLPPIVEVRAQFVAAQVGRRESVPLPLCVALYIMIGVGVKVVGEG